MQPEQALALLDQAASCAPGNRKDHAQVIEAVRILRELIESTKPKHQDPVK